ncbi:pilus assembly protein PilM [Candidatus Sumerlaeota bacterium]|nr:pilus assembly protein PilM [Candidatus Sumerlaeota bacterium]
MPTTHLALEFTDHRIRGALATVARGSATVGDLFELELPEVAEGGAQGAQATTVDAAASVGLALRQVLRGKGGRVQRTSLILPKAEVTTRMVTLPSTDPEELGRMAQFEAERHIPFHPERHIVSHHVVASDEMEGSRVFLAAADERVIDRALSTLRAAEVAVDVITVGPVAAHGALLQAEGEATRERVLALMVVGPESTDISVMQRGELLFSRSIKVARGEDEEAAALGQRLASELRRTHEFTRREYDCPSLDEVLVVGEAAPEHLAQSLGRHLRIPVRPVDLSRLAARCAEGVGNLRAVSEHFACIGEVLLPRPERALSINLTPPAYMAGRAAAALRRVAVATGALALVAVILTFIYLRVSQAALDESVRAHRRQERSLRPHVERMQDQQTQIAIIRSYVDERNSALAILDFLSGVEGMPPRNTETNIPSVRWAVNDFEYDREDGTLVLTGYTRTFNDIQELRQILEGTGFFSRVTIVRREEKPLSHGRGTVHEYVFRCELAQGELPRAREGETARGARRPSHTGAFLEGSQ